MTSSGVSTTVGVALALVACAGCGGVRRAPQLRTGTLAGTVSEVSGGFCVARHDAKGFCVKGADARGTHVGECVSVSVTWPQSNTADIAPNGITDIRPANANEHPQDC